MIKGLQDRYIWFAVGAVALAGIIILLLVASFAAEFKLTGALLFLMLLSLLLKFPDSFSSTGGLEISMVLGVMIAAIHGFKLAALFLFVLLTVGAYIVKERPQSTALTLFFHLLFALLASVFATITPENFLWVTMVFLLISHLVSGPFYVLTGWPLQSQLMFMFVNLLWNYIFFNNFGLIFYNILT